MRKSKNHYFDHIFVSPGDTPGAITLNVVWMEREFDAYKLSRCICPSNYNRFWDRARYWSKIVIFSYPRAFDAPVRGSRRNSATPFGIEKLEWLGYPMVKKFRRYLYLFCIEKLEWLGYPMVKKFLRYLYLFWHNSRTWQTHTQTDTACWQQPRLCIALASHGKKWYLFILLLSSCVQFVIKRSCRLHCGRV